MPVVTVDMLEGRTEEQKKVLVEGITATFGKIGVKPDVLNIIIREVSRNNWALNGKTFAEK